MNPETILSVIVSKGVFQINPLSYRNEKTMKVLKKLLKDGVVTKQRVNASTVNYFIKEQV